MDVKLERKVIKILLVGDSMVGKNSICEIYILGKPTLNEVCQIARNYESKLKLKNGKEIKLIILNTNGQEIFHSISINQARNAHWVIIVFSVDKRSSFENIQSWKLELDGNGIKNYALFGNKIDIPKDEWRITTEEAKKYAQRNNMAYFETSCKTREGIEEGFSYFANELYEKLENQNSNNIKLKKTGTAHESNCAGKKKNKKK